jgi:hypothetical protein
MMLPQLTVSFKRYTDERLRVPRGYDVESKSLFDLNGTTAYQYDIN